MPMYQCIDVSRPIYSCRRICHANVSMYLGLYTHADVYFLPMLGLYTHADVYFMPMYQCNKAYILMQTYISSQCIDVTRPITHADVYFMPIYQCI